MERLEYWIAERERIRERKEDGERFLTKDPILQRYRFCNVHREDDRVTRWIAANWRYHDDKHTWHAMIVARFINWPETLAYCGYPEPWGGVDGRSFKDALRLRELRGMRVFTGAYIVSTNGAKGSKVEHVIKLFDRSWMELQGKLNNASTCARAYALLRGVNGIGSFMAAQVVADLKYTSLLENAPDWKDFVAPGPGSQRGLNRILGFSLDSKWPDKKFQERLLELRSSSDSKLLRSLHLQDLQNCLCEFDKYERVLHNEGRPRSTYQPSSEPMP